MKDKLKLWWQGHGTKILGVITTVYGVIQEALGAIQAVDTKHAAVWALVIVLGGAVIKRGFTNSKKDE